MDTCGNPVDDVCKRCGRHVLKNKSPRILTVIETPKPIGWPVSRPASLESTSQTRKINALPDVIIHRYEEKIAGRTYLIEVSPVTETRWRAQIARRPGMPTSLMPFYGQTPDEAARELSKWLSLVAAPVTANT